MPPKIPDTKKSQDWLYEQYARMNKKFWDNQLPSDILIQIVPMGRVGYSIDCRHHVAELQEAMTTTFPEGLSRPIIEFNEITLDYLPYAKAVLFHEMIHISGVHKHGREFKAAIKKLAAKGALEELLK